MADLSQVLDGLRDAVAAALYPTGVPAGKLPRSVANAPARVYVGWPDATLDADLKAGICHVSIVARQGMSDSHGPYLGGWVDLPSVTASMTATVVGTQATFAGTNTSPAMIAAVIVDDASYTYPVQPTDTPAQVAAALAAAIAADRPATAEGAVLTVPDSYRMVARVVAGGTSRREVRRVSQAVQITAWCPSPSLRDAVIMAIDEALADEQRTLPMPDGSLATVSYEGTGIDEAGRQQPLHRRDLFVSVEYSMGQTQTVPGIAATVVPIEDETSKVTRVVIT